MQENDLFADSAANSYDAGVTDSELWVALGQALADHRERRGFDSPKRLKAKIHAAPNERTIEAIEKGRPGNASSITEYCEVLGLSLVDVLTAVLPHGTMSADASAVAPQFDSVSLEAQNAVKAVLAIAPKSRATPPSSPPGPGAATLGRRKRASQERER